MKKKAVLPCKNSLTKEKEECYNRHTAKRGFAVCLLHLKAAKERSGSFRKNAKKLLEKSLKKGLTKQAACGILYRLSARGGSEWSLKIEQQRGQSTKEICERSRQFLRETKLFQKSKKMLRAKARHDFRAGARAQALIYQMIESLILAQDERWRRA